MANDGDTVLVNPGQYVENIDFTGKMIIVASLYITTNDSSFNEIFFFSEESPISYSNIEGGWQGEGNLNYDPQFRDPVNGNYHLKSISCGDESDSPCIDMGDPSLQDSLLDCNWGLGNSRSDMGAYGGGYKYAAKNQEQTHNRPSNFSLSQNYPNPFNPLTTINYHLIKTGDVDLSIFNLLGQKVATLVSEKQLAGQHRVEWNASGFSSGIYLYRIMIDNHNIQTKKMILLR